MLLGGAILVFVAAGLLALFGLELTFGVGHRHASGATYYKPAGYELSAASVSFASDLEGVVNAASKQNGSTFSISHVSCIQGSPEDFFCAYLLHGRPQGDTCMAGQFHRSNAELVPVKAGRVRVSVARCGALNAIRSLR
jgi:hypothetical protein